LPSQFAEVTGRPDKFLALHFASGLWKNNTAEVMKHLGTDQKVFQNVIEFAKNIGMVALPLYKEQPGYILNSLLVPFQEAALLLLMNQVGDIETIDKTWMIATGAPEGPFAILDAIGINSLSGFNPDWKLPSRPSNRAAVFQLANAFYDWLRRYRAA
jgi:3-hydroxyacyl-CoA dehydrogenase